MELANARLELADARIKLANARIELADARIKLAITIDINATAAAPFQDTTAALVEGTELF